MSKLLLIPLDDTVVFPNMTVTLTVDTGEQERVLLVPRHEGEYAQVGTVADVTDRVRPGVVASTKGRWPGHSNQGTTVNATVAERDSDMGPGALFHDNRVRVDKTA